MDWKIKTIRHDGSGVFPMLISDKTGTRVDIMGHLAPFGYRVDGPQGGIVGVFNPQPVEQQKDAMLDVLDEHIHTIRKNPDYWTIRTYLTRRNPKSNVEKLAIERVLSILKDEFQNLVKCQEEIIETENNKY